MGLLEHKKLDQVSCQKGFMSFGAIQDLVTIKPEQYASLCFGQAGTIHPNAWLEPDDPKGTMNPTATIRVNEVMLEPSCVRRRGRRARLAQNARPEEGGSAHPTRLACRAAVHREPIAGH